MHRLRGLLVESLVCSACLPHAVILAYRMSDAGPPGGGSVDAATIQAALGSMVMLARLHAHMHALMHAHTQQMGGSGGAAAAAPAVQAAAAAAAERCVCGNYASGQADGLCNACRRVAKLDDDDIYG